MYLSPTPTEKRLKIGLTNNQLKLIAMISMFIDHLGLELFPHLEIFRIVGRLAFPLFAYMIAEGCTHTKNKLRYFTNLFVLGMLCQIVFYQFTKSLYQGILITFSLSISCIFAIENFRTKKNWLSLILLTLVIFITFYLAIIAPVIFKNQGFKLDYGYLGVLLPIVIYFSKGKFFKLIATAIIIYFSIKLSPLQIYSFTALPLLLLYNGQRGKQNLKYLFYIFYPSHLALVYLLGAL